VAGALLLDFYGTLVDEDTAQIAEITARIAEASPALPTPAQVARSWSARFARGCAAAHGASFRSQREVELASLADVLAEFGAPLDPMALSQRLFDYWMRPAPRPGAAEFLAAVRGRAFCVVSNIDTADLRAALAALGWEFARVVTSESCRAYKPRPEMFARALESLGCTPEAALHVGDSIGSDLVGAAAAGIAAVWVNPSGRALPAGLAREPRHVVGDLRELIDLV